MELFLELLLNGLGELLIELVSPFDRHPVGRVVAWAVCGVVLGGFSVVFFSTRLLHSPTARAVNLALSPLFFGGLSLLVSTARRRPPWSHAFASAAFALAFALMRWP